MKKVEVSECVMLSLHVLVLKSVQGAGEIAKYLLQTYGPDSIAMIVDEGGKFQTFLIST